MSTASTPDRRSNTHTITRNSLWYGLELLSSSLASVIVSVLVARIIGPMRLGYYTYVMTLANFTVALGVFGLPNTTRKYMAEYLNSGQPGLAHAVYRLTLRLQFWIAATLTCLALAVVLLWGDPAHRLVAVLLVLNMGPRMLGSIPAQANNAAETCERNTLPAVISNAANLALTLASLWIGWDLPGLAAALLASTVLDTLWKLHIVRHWLRETVPVPISPVLRRQLFVFSSQGLVLMLLNVLVWDRSDIFFLKQLNPDIRQVTFFGTAFNLVERVLNLPNALVGSVALTLMAQYGRGSEKLREMTVDGARYAFLLALPLLAGMAAVSPAVPLVYGSQYRPLVPVLALVALLAIPKTLTLPGTTLLQATENQRFLVIWGCLCGVVNIGLDVLLTPRYGAIGAAIGNGSAQAFSTVGVWVYVYRVFRPDLRVKAFARIAVSGLGMYLAVVLTAWAVPLLASSAPARAVTVIGLAASVGVGVLTWCILLRWTGALDKTDADRLRTVGKVLPRPVRPAWNRAVGLVAAA